MINKVADRKAKDRGVKIQGWGAHYDKWVLTKLIELEFETSENSLVARIVREWVERHAEEHRLLGLTPETFLRERRSAGGAKLYSFTRPESDKLDEEPEGRGAVSSVG